MQVVAEPGPLLLSVTDLGEQPRESQVAALEHLLAEEAARPFDLGTGPLFRAGLVRLGAEDHVLWLVFHHHHRGRGLGRDPVRGISPPSTVIS